MRKRRYLLALLLTFYLFSYGQQADLMLSSFPPLIQPDNLNNLKNGATAGVASLKVVNNNSTPGLDVANLYYNVHARMHFELLDKDDAVLLTELTVPCTLKVTGENPGSPGVDVTVTKYFDLSISPYKDEAHALYYFQADESNGMNLTNIDEAELTFQKTEVEHISSTILKEIDMSVSIESNRYVRGMPDLKTEFANGTDFKRNEAIITWMSTSATDPELPMLPIPALYELEWVYVHPDQLNLTYAELRDIDFSKNATRIQTKETYYPINVIYEDGYIVARVRMIRPLLNEDETGMLNKYAYGPWTIADDDHIVKFSEQGKWYEISKVNGDPTGVDDFREFNFQYNATYSSEGKKKEVLGLFDGSNRSRQNLTFLTNFDESRTATVINFNDPSPPDFSVDHNSTVIAQESYYDYNGQAVLDVLPTPLIDANAINYQENINHYSGNKLLPSDYDNVADNNPFVGALNYNATDVGAGQYYSSHNKALNQADPPNWAKYIPRANGYPYSKVEYMDDGSGRLKAQHNPGQVFANDATAVKNTRFFYATPTQSELNALFSANIGEAKYYKKNYTVDGNGVTNVAYIDNKDRTIATAIVGEPDPASNMVDVRDSLNHEVVEYKVFIEDMFQSGVLTYIEEDKSLRLQYSVYTPVDEKYTFDYELVTNEYEACSEEIQQSPQIINTLCFTCDYDYDFQIYDQDGVLLVDADVDLSTTNTPSNECSSHTYNFSTNLEYTGPNPIYDPKINQTTGKLEIDFQPNEHYTIIQTLRLNTDNLETNVDNYMQSTICDLQTEEDFIQSELDAADFTTCESEYLQVEEEPCDYIRQAIRKDFLYPSGAFVKMAESETGIVDFILMRTRREEACSSNVQTSTIMTNPVGTDEEDERDFRNGIIDQFLTTYGLSEQPTFAEFKTYYADFFIDYHPSYCKLYTCEFLNSENSRAFDRVLAESASIGGFLTDIDAEFPGLNVDPTTTMTFSTATSDPTQTPDPASEIIVTNYPRTIRLKYGDYYEHSTDMEKVYSTATPPVHQIFSATFQNNLALFPFDLVRYELEGFVAAGSKLSTKMARLEHHNVPSSLECYFKRDLNNNNSLWRATHDLWGTGAYDSDYELWYFMFNYMSNYYGCDLNREKGIAEIAYEAYPNDEIERWGLYKELYANAKRRMIEDYINYSSCEQSFWTTDITEGQEIHSDYFDLFYQDPGPPPTNPQWTAENWTWPRWYDWGDWWKNASDCDCYLGQPYEADDLDNLNLDLSDANLDLSNPDDIRDDVASEQDINDFIHNDILPLLEYQWTTGCYNRYLLGKADYEGNNPGKYFYIEWLNEADPYDFLDDVRNYDNVDNSCNPYDINLSSIFTKYYQNFQDAKDANDNLIFSSSNFKDQDIKINCDDLEQATLLANYPSALMSIPQITGREDIDPEDVDQRRFANYLNFKFGLNLGFESYYNLAEACTGNGQETVFNSTGNTVEVLARTKLDDIKDELITYGGTSGNFMTEETDIYAKINENVTPDLVDPLTDYVGYGQVNYANYHQDLFYLEDKRTLYDDLRIKFTAVLAELQSELNAPGKYPDFEGLETEHARIIENVEGAITITGLSTGSLDLEIDRAVRYSNGTIYVRLLDDNGDYYDDYYYHYRANEEDYPISDITSTSFNTSDFIDIEPVFDGESMHYAYISTSGASKTLLISTRKEIAKAERIAKTELNNLSGVGAFPLLEQCEDRIVRRAVLTGKLNYKEYMEGREKEFRANYISHCKYKESDPSFTQSLIMEYESSERNFTLYYYDQADNLVQTVPPQKVDHFYRNTYSLFQTTGSSAMEDQINDYRGGGSGQVTWPNHEKKTVYKYNAANQVIKQTTPNGGTSLFWYDAAGRLILSQNEEQRPSHRFSYTIYDGQSRIIETGEVVPPTASDLMYQFGLTVDDIWWNVNYTIFNGAIITAGTQSDPNSYVTTQYDLEDKILTSDRKEVVKTYYDNAVLTNGPSDFVPQNLRSRVATQAYFLFDWGAFTSYNWEYAIHYSYDPVGNVKTVLNDYYQTANVTENAHRFKRIDYDYDAISGNVFRVLYQKGKDDALYHRYGYDAENRITKVETSRDGIIWDEDANYKYYLHGPLARAELGNQKVQGVDYAYTINGWLKAVNSGVDGKDIGNDDEKADNKMGEDAFGFSLQYFNNDYAPISAANNDFLLDHPSLHLANLYNGNIAAKTMHRKDATIGTAYTYDMLNRLKGMEEHTLSPTNWSGVNSTDGYKSAYSYDGNGNITALERFDGATASLMDKLTYNYDIAGTDQLSNVDESPTISSTAFANDIDAQLDGNYGYDNIGNLKRDDSEEINIEWYPNGKVKRIIRDNPTLAKPSLFFEYDPLGNRVKKEVSFIEDAKQYKKTTYYVRDVQGNVMATYDERNCNYQTTSLPNSDDHYYEYSHDFVYYSTETVAEPTIGKTGLLNFLNTAYVAPSTGYQHHGTLAQEAGQNLDNISNVKNLMWPDVVVDDYLDYHPDAIERVVTEDPYYYADYMFNNDLTNFKTIVNDKNEAWIQKLKSDNLVVSFYNGYDANYAAEYNTSEQITNSQSVFSMNRNVSGDLIANNTTLFQSMLALTPTEFTVVGGVYNNPSTELSTLQSQFGQLEQEILIQDPGYQSSIRTITAILMIADLDNTELQNMLTGVTLSNFYAGLQAISAPHSDKLNSILLHVHNLFLGASLSSPISTGSLLTYKPMVAIDWTVDSNGDYLEEYLHTDESNSILIDPSANYFTGLECNNSDIYFTGGANRPYVTLAMIRNAGDPAINTALEASVNLTHTKDKLFDTEDLGEITSYYEVHFPYRTLEINYDDDGLQTALSGILNYSPLDYSLDLETEFDDVSFDLSFNPNPGCKTALLLQDFSIYGSSRLGTMNAEPAREDADNVYSRKLGAKSYELSDHLGNVVAVVSDKKLHPQETVPVGTQTIPDISYQPEVLARSDYYPFGMEMMDRSGTFNEINYTASTQKLVYEGLLDNCAIYDGVSGANEIQKNCTESTNVLGVDYVSAISMEPIPNQSTNIEMELYLEPHINHLIPVVDDNKTYRIIFYLSGTKDRNGKGKLHHSAATEVMQDDNPRADDDKTITFEYTGSEWNGYKDANGYLDFTIRVSDYNGGVVFPFEIVLENIKVYEIEDNTTVPVALRENKTYAYGFQGQERDDEVKGSGNSLAFRYRIHDPRLGRFLSLDPLAKEFPWNSPYSFAENKVISHRELEGLEAWPVIRDWESADEAKFQVFTAERIVEMQETNCKNDCADLAVQLIIEYANKEGLPIGFTKTDGKQINSTSTEFKDIGADKFMNKVKDQTNAMSIQNDMKLLDPGETPQPGDMTNSNTHVNVVRGLDTKNQESVSEDNVPTASGHIVKRVPKNNVVSKKSKFKEFKVIDNAVKKDTQEGIRLMNEAGGVQEGS